VEIFKLSNLIHIIKAEAYRLRQFLRSRITARRLAMSGPIANNLTMAYGAETATSIRSALEKAMSNAPPVAATVRWEGGENASLELPGLQPR
jgi:hypothetical protein